MDFVYIEKKTEISIDLGNFQANSNELGQLLYKNSKGLEELAVSDILDFAQDYLQDENVCGEVYTVSLQNGTALSDFDQNFFANSAVSIEGKGIEYGSGKITLLESFDEVKITFASEAGTLELTLENYTAPEKPVIPDDDDGFSYRFFTEEASIAEILAANEIVSSYYNIVSLSDENLVTIKGDEVIAENYFDEVILTLSLSDGTTVEIALQNPAPVQAGETVTTEGVGSFAAKDEVPAGTMLVVDSNPVVPEGIVLPGTDTKAGEQHAPVFFEVSLIGPDGEPVKAGADVTLNTAIELPEAPEGQIVKVTGVKVYHIGEKGDAEELEGATYALAEGKISSVSFTTPGFSLFAVTYTVDFVSAEVNKAWSWPGEGSYRIADIMAEIGVTGDIESVDLVRTVDVGGSEKSLYLSDDKTLLISETAFGDTYKLTVKVDNVKYNFVITDAQAVTDLTSLLASFSVNGQDMTSGGSLTVAPGDDLLLSLMFREKPMTVFDKSSNAQLTYQLPAGLTLPLAVSGTLVPSDVSLAEIYEVNYSATESGLITFTWNIKNPEAFQALEGMFIKLDLEPKVTAGKDENIILGEATLTVKDEHDLGVVKTGNYNSATNKMEYTVRVSSIGNNPGPITVTDTITGTALSLTNGSAAINYGTDAEHMSFAYNGNTLTATIDAMTGGQTIEFRYTADVNLETLKAAGAQNYQYGTVETTGNRVELTGWSDDNPDNNSDTHSVNHEIQLSSVGKSGASGIYENGKRMVNWQITANNEHLTGLTSITDTMGNGKDKMTYSGAGITVKVYDRSGSLVNTIPVSWSDLSVTEASESWTYTIPTQYQTADYSFVVDYTTAVDVAEAITAVDVSNSANTDYGQGGASAKAEPAPDNKLTLEKTATDVDIPGGKVYWDISFDVPAGGLSSAVVTDYLPNTKGGALGTFYDGYDSYTIDGLIDGESVVLSDETTKVGEDTFTSAKIFTFQKTVDGATVNGLYPVEGGRKVTIHLVTTLDEDWLNVEGINDSTAYTYFNHINTANIQADNVYLQDSDTVKIDNTEPSVQKSGQFFKNVGYSSSHEQQNTVTVPMYSYAIYLYNVDDSCFDANDKLVVRDTFNGDYLAYYTMQAEATGTAGYITSWDGNIINTNQNPWVYGTSHQNLWYKDATNATEHWAIDDSYVTVDNASGNVVFSIPKSAIPKDTNGNYWKEYSIHYFLYVKDTETLEQMKAQALAAGGTLSIGNTAVVADRLTSTADVTFDVPIVSKNFSTINDAAGEYSFTIDINPTAARLGSSDFLTVTDSYRNLSVDYNSITCTPSNALVNLDHSGNTITYVIRNGVHVTLSYTAFAVTNGDFSNTVRVNGQSKSIGGTATITARGDTGSSNLNLTVQKHAAGNMLEVLEGVEFELYHYDESAENHRGEQVTGTFITDARGQIKLSLPVLLDGNDYLNYEGNVTVQDASRTTAASVATDRNGKLTVTITGAGSASITEIPAGTTYEVTEPTENLPTGWHQVGDVVYSDTTKTITANDTSDTVTITNTTTGSIKLKKIMTVDGAAVGGNTEATFTFAIAGESTDANTSGVFKTVVITLNNDGTYSATIQVGSETPVELTKEGDYFVIPDLPLGAYTITESGADRAGYNLVTTFAVGGTNTATNSAAVTLNGTTLTATVDATNAYTAGVELPSTGGSGTAFYTASGLVLLLGASLWLIFRRRKREQN